MIFDLLNDRTAITAATTTTTAAAAAVAAGGDGVCDGDCVDGNDDEDDDVRYWDSLGIAALRRSRQQVRRT